MVVPYDDQLEDGHIDDNYSTILFHKKTNRFHATVCLFSNRSQKRQKVEGTSLSPLLFHVLVPKLTSYHTCNL